MLVFSRALREKKEPRVKSLSLLSKWGIILLLLLLSMMTRRDDVARHTRSKGTIIKEKETYRSYDERSVILRGNKHNLCVCVYLWGCFFLLQKYPRHHYICGSDKVWQFLVFTSRYLNDDIYDISLSLTRLRFKVIISIIAAYSWWLRSTRPRR